MKRLTLHPLPFALLLMTVVCPMAAAQDSLHVIIFGQVFDEQTGKPLAGVRVFITPLRQSAVTDADGLYRIDEVPFGTSNLFVSQRGYATQTVSFHITKQAEYRYNVDLVKTDKEKTMVKFLHITGLIGRALQAPPGVPADRVAALRAAFTATMKDPAFVAEIKKRKLPLNPSTGEQMQAFIESVMGTSPKLIAELKAALASK